MNDYIWSISHDGSTAVLYRFGEGQEYNADQIIAQIEEIKKNRRFYLNQQSWNEAIAIYEHGLEILKQAKL